MVTVEAVGCVVGAVDLFAAAGLPARVAAQMLQHSGRLPGPLDGLQLEHAVFNLDGLGDFVGDRPAADQAGR